MFSYYFRHPIFLFLILSYSITQAQTPNLIWSDTIIVADGNIYGQKMPKIAVTSNGEPIIVWGKLGTPSNMFVSDWKGSSFNPPVNIIPSGINPRIAGSTPEIATYNDDVYITYSNLPEIGGHIYIQKSIDGGVNFGDTVRVDTYPDSTRTYSPSIDITDDGNPAIVFFRKHEIDLSTYGVVATRSYDGGQTFIPDQNCSLKGPGVPTDCCKPMITVDGSHHAVLYRNTYAGRKEIYASVSNNNGASFDSVVRIDRSNYITGVCPASNPDGILIGNTLYGIWMTIATGIPRVQIGTMDVSTATFGFNMDVDTTKSDSTYQKNPRITGSGDTLAMVWADDRDSKFINDCYFRFSVNGISNLSPIYKINIETNGDQVTPDVAYYKGVFHFVFSDYTNRRVIYRKATLDLPNSVLEKDKPKFNLYPNPFNKTMTINFEDMKDISSVVVYDALGNTIFSQKTSNNSLTINTSNYSSGVYFVSIINSKGETFNKKMVK